MLRNRSTPWKRSAVWAIAALLAACAPHAQTPASSAASPLAAVPTPLVLPTEAPPQILAVQLSDSVFHSGETVTGTIVTSTNVSDVRVQFGGRSAPIPQREPGVFALSYTLPHIPFFLAGTYTAQVVARNPAGLSASRNVSVSIR
jgi:hypothetical protein